MGSKRNKMLEQQEAEARRQYQAALIEAQKPSALESEQERRSLEFLRAYDTPGKDVTQLPGLSPFLQIGRAAEERARRERMGSGALQLGGVGAEGYAAKLREQYAQEAAQSFGSGLEGAVAGRYAEATGSILPLAQLQQSRKMGVLGATQSREGSYLNAPRETPFWKQAALAGIQGAAGIATAGVGQGGRWSA